MSACLLFGAVLFGVSALTHYGLRSGWPRVAPQAAFALCFAALPTLVLALSVALDRGHSARVLASPGGAIVTALVHLALVLASRRRLLESGASAASARPWPGGAFRDLVVAPLAVIALDAALATPGDGHHQDEVLAVLVAALAALSVRHLADDRPFANYLIATIPFAVVVARFLYTPDFPLWDSRLFLFPVFERVGTELAQGRFFSPWHLDPGGIRLGVLHINFLAATPHRIPGYFLLAFTTLTPATAYKISLVFGAWLIGLGWNLVLRALIPSGIAVYVGTLMVLLGGTGITFHQEQSLASIELLPWFALALLHSRTQRAWLLVVAAILGLGTSQHYPQMQAIMLGSTAIAGAVLALTRTAGFVAARPVGKATLFACVALLLVGTLPALYTFTRLPSLASEMRVGSNFAPDNYDLYVRLYGPNMSSAPPWYFGQYMNPVFLVARGFIDRCGLFVGRVGLLAVAAALVGLLAGLTRRLTGPSAQPRPVGPPSHPDPLALTAAFALCLLLAAGLTLGSHGPVPRVLFALHLPYINAFRQWVHFFPWVNLSLSGLAALAVAHLVGRARTLAPDTRRKLVLVGTALLAVQTADLALNARRYCDRMCPSFAPREPLARFFAQVPLGATRVFELRPAFELHHSSGTAHLWEAPFVASRRVHVDGGWQAELAACLALQRAGETTAAVVSSAGDGQPAGTPVPRHAPLVPSLEGGGVDVQVRDLERPSLVVIPAAYEDGLVAEVDGAPAALDRVDGAISGVLVPAGTHRVAIRLRGDPYPYLAGLSWLTQLGIALAFLLAPRPTPDPRRVATTRATPKRPRRTRVTGPRG